MTAITDSNENDRILRNVRLTERQSMKRSVEISHVTKRHLIKPEIVHILTINLKNVRDYHRKDKNSPLSRKGEETMKM